VFVTGSSPEVLADFWSLATGEAHIYRVHLQVLTLLVHLSDNQQRHVGNDIEDKEEDFEQPEERVKDHIEGFS
jgi:hypothetical protein